VAKAIVHSAAQAGYSVVYREAHNFFADIFEATQTGKQKDSKAFRLRQICL